MAPRRRNPEGARVLRAIAALLLLDDPHRGRRRRRAWRSPRKPRARGPVEFYHGLLEVESAAEVPDGLAGAGAGRDPAGRLGLAAGMAAEPFPKGLDLW